MLAPGTSTVTGTYRLAGASQATAQTAALRTASHRHGTGIVASDGVLHRGGHHVATLATAGGCFPAPQEPGVISSIYGPLIQGTGVIDCTVERGDTGEVIGLYMGSTQLSNAGGRQLRQLSGGQLLLAVLLVVRPLVPDGRAVVGQRDAAVRGRLRLVLAELHVNHAGGPVVW